VKTFGPCDVGEVVRRIYDARIPARIEWMFDDGFVWVLLGGGERERLPRVWLDDMLEGARTLARSEAAA
jgi:hypothetical protein